MCGVPGPVPGLTVNALVRCADKALYESKAAGRDRVTVHPFDPTPTHTSGVLGLLRA